MLLLVKNLKVIKLWYHIWNIFLEFDPSAHTVNEIIMTFIVK